MVEYTSFGEYSRSILEKGNFLRSLWKIHPWDQSWKTKVVFTLYLPFCWSWLGGGEISSKKMGQQKKGPLKSRIRHLCTLILEFQENFMQILPTFISFFGDQKKNSFITSSLGHWILFICLAIVQVVNNTN